MPTVCTMGVTHNAATPTRTPLLEELSSSDGARCVDKGRLRLRTADAYGIDVEGVGIRKRIEEGRIGHVLDPHMRDDE